MQHRGVVGATKAQAIGSGLHWPTNLCHQLAEVRLLNQIQAATAVLGGLAKGIERVVDEGAVTAAVLAFDFR